MFWYYFIFTIGAKFSMIVEPISLTISLLVRMGAA